MRNIHFVLLMLVNISLFAKEGNNENLFFRQEFKKNGEEVISYSSSKKGYSYNFADSKISISVGVLYTNLTNYGRTKTGGTSEEITNTAHLGGFSLDFDYFFAKKWAFYTSVSCAFGSPFTHIITTKFRTPDEYRKDSCAITSRSSLIYGVNANVGFLYVFHLTDNFHLHLGGAFSIGGAGLKRNGVLVGKKTLDSYNVLLTGGALKLDAVYRCNRLVSLVAGAENAFCATPFLSITRNGNKKNVTGRQNMYNYSVGSFSNLFTLKLALRFAV